MLLHGTLATLAGGSLKDEALRRSRSAQTVIGGIFRWALRMALVALALIGFLHLTRGTAVRHVRGVAADGVPIGVSEPEFPVVVTMLTGTSILPGHRVEVTLNGNGTYERLWEDLRSARQSITLRAAGVVVEPFRPIRLSALHLAQNRSHVRGVIIDSRIGWTGGFGIDDKWLGDGRTSGSWRETNVRFEGPAVRQLQAAFVAAWTEATGVLFTGRATLAQAENGTVTAGLLHTAPTLGSTSAERFFALSIAGARKTLYITNAYFAPDRNFVELLATAARRGVDVRILTAGGRTDVNIVRQAGRAWYDMLLAAGVRIYEWQPTTLHAKTFVVDGEWFTIGSMNFDNRSMALNDESTLMVLDTSVGQQMNSIFFDDLKYAAEISTAAFRQRSWFERLAEQGANVITRLL